MIINRKQHKRLFLTSFLVSFLISNICYGGNEGATSEGAGDGLTCIHYKINNYTDNLYMFVAHGVTNLAMKTEAQTIIKKGNKTTNTGKPSLVTTGIYYFSSDKRHDKNNELKIRIIPMLENRPPILNPDKSTYYYCGKEIYKKLPVIKINPYESSQYSKTITFKGDKLVFSAIYNLHNHELIITIHQKSKEFEL